MKTKIVLMCLALTALISTNYAAEPNELSTKENAGGWKLLFDGKTLSGWRGFKTDKPGSGWAVMDGAITRTGKSGDLLTADDFGDFELAIEWKVEKATNSGIIYRVGLNETQTFRTGPEYQVLDNRDAKDNKDPKHLAGSLYDIVAPPKDVTKPVGEWNQTRIWVKGWHVQHWLNGEKVVDVDLGSPEGKAMIAGSKFSSMPNFATLSRGHIALQDHDESVSFRSIKIRDLK